MTSPTKNDKPTPAPLEQKPLTGNNANWDDDEEDEPLGDPAKVKNAGPLESLGRAISSPVLESEEDQSDALKKPASGR